MHPDGTGAEPLTSIAPGHQRWLVHSGGVVVPIEVHSGFGATQPRYTPDGTPIVLTAELPPELAFGVITAEGGAAYILDCGASHHTWQPGVAGSIP